MNLKKNILSANLLNLITEVNLKSNYFGMISFPKDKSKLNQVKGITNSHCEKSFEAKPFTQNDFLILSHSKHNPKEWLVTTSRLF